MKIKVYQAIICYKDHNVTTVLCKTLEDLMEIISQYDGYLHYERFEITIKIEDGKTKDIVYDCLDVD